MKKILAAILTLTLLLTAVCFAEAADFTGVWHLNKIAMGDQELDAAAIGMKITLTLNENGTAIMETTLEEADTTEGTWELQDGKPVITLDGDVAAADFVDEYLVLSADDETTMKFGREEAAGFVAPETVAANDIAEFDGTWTMVNVDAYGMVVPAEMVLPEAEMLFGGTEPSVIIENGSVKAFGREVADAFVFEDGKLIAKAPEVEDIDASLLEQTVALNADGTIAYTVMGMIFYCEKAA